MRSSKKATLRRRKQQPILATDEDVAALTRAATVWDDPNVQKVLAEVQAQYPIRLPSDDAGRPLPVIDVDADPHNANWIRILEQERLARESKQKQKKGKQQEE